MGTPLGPKYIPYTYMDPLGQGFAGSGLGFKSLGFRVLRPSGCMGLGFGV